MCSQISSCLGQRNQILILVSTSRLWVTSFLPASTALSNMQPWPTDIFLWSPINASPLPNTYRETHFVLFGYFLGWSFTCNFYVCNSQLSLYIDYSYSFYKILLTRKKTSAQKLSSSASSLYSIQISCNNFGKVFHYLVLSCRFLYIVSLQFLL